MKTIKIPQKDIVSEFFKLVKIPSDNNDCSGVADFISSEFKGLHGWKVREQIKEPGSLNLVITPIAKLRAKTFQREKPLFLAAHMDTVTPGRGIIPAIKGDRIVSVSDTILGADNKSAIAVFIAGLKIAKKYGLALNPIEFVFTFGEEHGLTGAHFLNNKLIQAKQGFCFDAGGDVGTITTSAPNYIHFVLYIKGRSSHSGIEPEKGISAIKVLSEIMASLPNGRINAETTTNIGMVSGGLALNIVPEKAIAEGEIRSIDMRNISKHIALIRFFAGKVCQHYGAAYRLSLEKQFSGFLVKPDDPLLKKISVYLTELGIKTKLNTSNGGSDANVFNGKGLRTLNLAVGMRNVHTKNEYITIANLIKATGLFLKIVSKEKIEVKF